MKPGACTPCASAAAFAWAWRYRAARRASISSRLRAATRNCSKLLVQILKHQPPHFQNKIGLDHRIFSAAHFVLGLQMLFNKTCIFVSVVPMSST